MSKKNLYKGLTNNFADHSQSNLSWLHPHLAQDCRAFGTNTVSLDLLSSNPFPENFRASKELESAVTNWRNRFRDMVTKTGLDLTKIRKANVSFKFNNDSDYAYGADVCAELELNDGTLFKEKPWVPKSIDPAHMIPNTNLQWPDKFIKKNDL